MDLEGLEEECSRGPESASTAGLRDFCLRALRECTEKNLGDVEVLVQRALKSNTQVSEILLHSVAVLGLNPTTTKLLKALGFEEELLLCTLDAEDLRGSGLVSDSRIKAISRSRIDCLYRQKRFNLVREESEGFCKLMVFLLRSGDLSVEYFRKICGQFSLDPARVASVVLNTYSYRADVPSYLDLLECTTWAKHDRDHGLKLAQIIGMTLNKSKQWEPSVRLGAKLIRLGYLSLAELYPYLRTSEAEFQKLKAVWKKAVVDKANVGKETALALAAPLPDESDEDDESDDEVNCALPQSMEKKEEYDDAQRQRCVLVEELLRQGEEHAALQIITRFPFIVQFEPAIADLILYAVDGAIDQWYRDTVPLPSSSPVEAPTLHLAPVQNFKDLQAVSKVWLRVCGSLLGRNSVLFTKLSRLGRHLYQNDAEGWQEYTRQYLLGAISLLGINPLAVEEAYQLFLLFPANVRLALFTEWDAVLPETDLQVMLAVSQAEKETKNILKRISNTNVNEMMNQLAMVSYANPLPTFRTFLQQIESYDKIGLLVVDAAQKFSNLDWTVLPLVVLMQLQLSRGALKENGLFQMKWLRSLSRFIADLAAAYATFDISLIIELILCELHLRDTTHMIVLTDILESVGGCVRLTNLTLSDIERLCCSHAAKQVALHNLCVKPVVDVKRLLSVFEKIGMAEFLVGICAQLNDTASKIPNDDNAKVLSHNCDQIVHAIQLYLQLLSRADLAIIEKEMVPLPDLCVKYGVSVAASFDVWRSVLYRHIRQDSADDALERMLNWTNALAPQVNWDQLSRNLYVMFWILKAYDINYPEKVYDELAGHNASSTQSFDLENKRHLLHVQKTIGRIRSLKTCWFPSSEGGGSAFRRQSMLQFLLHCVLPRAMWSPLDALYASCFISKLHELGTENFSTLTLLDTLFADNLLTAVLLSSTEYECGCLATFLLHLLGTLNAWCVCQETYELRAWAPIVENGTSMYNATMLRSRDENLSERESDKSKLVDFATFEKLMAKWNTCLLTLIQKCLESEDYMPRRNAIVVLRELLDVFPQDKLHINILIAELSRIKESDDRDDVKLAATALYGQLYKKNEKERIKPIEVQPSVPEQQYVEHREDGDQSKIVEAEDKHEPEPEPELELESKGESDNRKRSSRTRKRSRAGREDLFESRKEDRVRELERRDSRRDSRHNREAEYGRSKLDRDYRSDREYGDRRDRRRDPREGDRHDRERSPKSHEPRRSRHYSGRERRYMDDRRDTREDWNRTDKRPRLD